MGITVYGAEWCHDTQRTREYLDGLGLPYEFVDIDVDSDGEEKVLEANEGKRRIPLVEVQFGTAEQLLRVPSNDQLRSVIERAEDAA
jgi:thioredoxin reductase (NADPH)